MPAQDREALHTPEETLLKLSTSLSRRTIPAIAGVVGLALLLVIGFVVQTALQQNQADLESSRRAVEKALEERRHSLSLLVLDYAKWTDAYIALHDKVDINWAYTEGNLGASLNERFGVDGIFVYGPQGHATYAVVGRDLRSPQVASALGGGIDRLVEMARAVPPPSEASGGLITYDGHPAIAYAAAISPYGSTFVQVAPGPPSVLVLVIVLNPALLERIGQNRFVNTLRLADDEVPPDQRIELATLDGTHFILTWDASEPGTQLLRAVLPWLAVLAFAMAALTWLVLRQAFRSARLLEASRQALEVSETRFRTMADHVPVIIWTSDEQGAQTYANRRWAEFTGRLPADSEGDGWLLSLLPEDKERIRDAYFGAVSRREPGQFEYRLRHHDGTWRWVINVAMPWCDANGSFRGHIGAVVDIDERKQTEVIVRKLALEDPLTTLPNRRMLHEMLSEAQSQAPRSRRSLGLLLVDLDHFKQVNDTLGHSAGDRLLVEAARRLRLCVREADVVARLGGDEFAVLVRSAPDAKTLSGLADRLVTRLHEPFAVGDTEVHCGASVGIAVSEGGEIDPELLLAQADLALYAAKEAGRNTWRFFQVDMRKRAYAQMALERELREDLEHGKFVLHYQPVIRIDDFALSGFESLIRWEHRTRGLLQPSEFLPSIERNRLIVPLSFWTVEVVIRQVGAWRRGGLSELCVGLNLATSALEAEGLVDHVANLLRAEELPATAIVVEVTEGVFVDSAKAVEVLRSLHDLGVRVAIDDFGAGHSSLGRLGRLPVDLLKIDRAFINSLGETDEAILRAIVELARSMNLTTVAEGIETMEQLALVRRVGVNWVQGFLFARAMPATDVPRWAQTFAERGTLDAQHDLLRRDAFDR